MKNKILSNVIASRRRERINCGTILSRQRRSNPVSILNSSVMQLISFLILAAKVLLFTCFFISTQHAIAATTAADELAQLLNNTRTMQAKFEQFSINRSGARMGQKTTGSMMLERPGKFRWEITQPNKQLIIVNKNRTYLYDADLEQVVKRKVDYNNPSNPAMLLSSPVESMKARGQVLTIDNDCQSRNINVVDCQDLTPSLWFELKPKKQRNQETGYQWIKIHFVNGQLNAMIIADNLDQKSQINFTNVVVNSQIPVKMFIFTPPPNTDVFDAGL